jgi:hypothetical protein
MAATHDVFVVLAVVAIATVAALLLIPRHVPPAVDDVAEAAG